MAKLSQVIWVICSNFKWKKILRLYKSFKHQVELRLVIKCKFFYFRKNYILDENYQRVEINKINIYSLSNTVHIFRMFPVSTKYKNEKYNHRKIENRWLLEEW